MMNKKKKMLNKMVDQSKLIIIKKIKLNLVKTLKIKSIEKINIFIVYDQCFKIEFIKNFIEDFERYHKNIHFLPLKGGESVKSFSHLKQVLDWLIQRKATRLDYLVGIGGGTIGDLCGLSASLYMRGMKWINIPTTLLSQVDSSLGGKTAINYFKIKNIIGQFYEPQMIITSPLFLKSLSDRDYHSGISEVLKYALIQDYSFYLYLLKNHLKIAKKDPHILFVIIKKCLTYKQKIVRLDRNDTLGIRESLNFGHTIGHAIEKVFSFNYFNHGEAIFWGLKIESYLSFQMNLLTLKEFLKIVDFINLFPHPSLDRKINLKKFKESMLIDKKNKNGEIYFVPLKKIGQYQSKERLDLQSLVKAFDYFKLKYI